MELIPRKTVDQIWIQVAQSTVSELKNIYENFKTEQPYIHKFINKFNEHLDDEVADLALYFSKIIWSIYNMKSSQRLPEISTDKILETVEKRESWLDILDDFDLERSYKFINSEPEINQKNLINYTLDMLIEEVEDNFKINRQDETYLLWLFIVLVEIFDQIN